MAQFNSDFRSLNTNGKPQMISTLTNLAKSNKEIFNTNKTLNHNSEYSNGPLKLKSNQNNYTSDIEKELTDLTLSIGNTQLFNYRENTTAILFNFCPISEKEMERQQKVISTCYKCSKSISDRNEACQAMGNTYHADCFTCVSCGRTLKGKPFYNINNNVYCEEDYLYSGFLENAEKCSVCGHVIVDMILQAIGNLTMIQSGHTNEQKIPFEPINS